MSFIHAINQIIQNFINQQPITDNYWALTTIVVFNSILINMVMIICNYAINQSPGPLIWSMRNPKPIRFKTHPKHWRVIHHKQLTHLSTIIVVIIGLSYGGIMTQLITTVPPAIQHLHHQRQIQLQTYQTKLNHLTHQTKHRGHQTLPQHIQQTAQQIQRQTQIHTQQQKIKHLKAQLNNIPPALAKFFIIVISLTITLTILTLTAILINNGRIIFKS